MCIVPHSLKADVWSMNQPQPLLIVRRHKFCSQGCRPLKIENHSPQVCFSFIAHISQSQCVATCHQVMDTSSHRRAHKLRRRLPRTDRDKHQRMSADLLQGKQTRPLRLQSLPWQIHRGPLLAQSRQSHCRRTRSPGWSHTPRILLRRSPGTPTLDLDLLRAPVVSALLVVTPLGSRSPPHLRGWSRNQRRHSRRHTPPESKTQMSEKFNFSLPNFGSN